MPRDAVSRTANVERNGGQKWVKATEVYSLSTQITIFERVPDMAYRHEGGPIEGPP